MSLVRFSAAMRPACSRVALPMVVFPKRSFGGDRVPIPVNSPGGKTGDNIADIDQAVGREHEELVAAEKGHRRFNRGQMFGPWGTQENPAKILSALPSRHVGCVGAGVHTHMPNFFELYAGKKTVCIECGQFFILVNEGDNQAYHNEDDATLLHPIEGYVP
jgi:hypothetical protein